METRYQCQFCNFINTFGNDVIPGSRVLCQSCKRPFVLPTNLAKGSVIDDFVIDSLLGAGSIGKVYKATQLSLSRTVALKVLNSEFCNQKGLSDFLREARVAANLNHLNLVQSYAIGEAAGHVFMAMNYITGLSLKERLARDKIIQTDEALHIIQQIAEGLHYAWTEAKIIHRDIKPENIIITDGGIVKITDLGLAMRPDDWKEGMEISGSPAYMSPEQFYGEKLDTRSDIYSMGIMLYQMLSGVLPFKSDDINELARDHIQKEAIALSKVNRLIPAQVSGLVRKMMAKYREDRFLNMEELLEHICRIRQKTAPSSDLIPSIHTISVRRLDYERQIEVKKHRGEIQQQHNELNPYIPIGTLKKTWQTHPAFWAIFVFVMMIMFTTIGFLWLQNKNLIRGHETPSTELALRKKILIFKERITEPSVTTSYVQEQSESLLREIKEINAPVDLKDMILLLVEKHNIELENRKNINLQSANALMKEQLVKLSEENKLLGAKLLVTTKEPDSEPNNYYQEQFNNNTLKISALELELDSLKSQIVINSLTYKNDVRILTIFYYFMNLRFGPPGINAGFLDHSPIHFQQFEDNEIKFFERVTQTHYRMSEVLAKPSMLSNATFQYNNETYRIRGTSNNDLIAIDKAKNLTRIALDKISDKEMIHIYEQALPSLDSRVLRFTYYFSKGLLGDALLYTSENSPASNITYSILDIFFDRFYYLMRKYPQNIPRYETMVKKITGKSKTTQKYWQKFEEYLQMYQALKPSEPLTDSIHIENNNHTPTVTPPWSQPHE